jgi:hypothetical protein
MGGSILCRQARAPRDAVRRLEQRAGNFARAAGTVVVNPSLETPMRAHALLLSMAALSAPSLAADPLHRAIGTWTGHSDCLAAAGPACHDETIVYRIAPSAHAGRVMIYGDKIIAGQREPMGALELREDPRTHALFADFSRGVTRGRWAFGFAGDELRGALAVLPDARVLVRRVVAHRVDPSTVPPAPPDAAYAE